MCNIHVFTTLKKNLIIVFHNNFLEPTLTLTLRINVGNINSQFTLNL